MKTTIILRWPDGQEHYVSTHECDLKNNGINLIIPKPIFDQIAKRNEGFVIETRYEPRPPKIVQIAVTPAVPATILVDRTQFDARPATIIALLEDGSLWQIHEGPDERWFRIPAVPVDQGDPFYKGGEK